MKILQVIDKLDLGGAERVFVDLTNILYENKYDVCCLFLIEKGYLSKQLNSNIAYFELNRKNKFSFQKIFECANILKKYDVIHCHMRHVYRYIKLISKIFAINNVIIFHEHSGLINSNSKIPFLFNSYFKPKYYIGVSKSHTEWAINKIRIDKKNVFYLPNTIIWDNCIHEGNKVRQSDFLLIGNIKETKNHIFAVEIAKKLNKSLNIIGYNQSKLYFEELEKKIVQLGADVIIYENIDSVKNQILSSKMGISTSFHESGPLVLIEFLCAGLPFLSYKTGEVSEIVHKYYPEFFIDNFNIDDWSNRIKLILGNNYSPDNLQEIYTIHFSPSVYYTRLTKIYDQVCGS